MKPKTKIWIIAISGVVVLLLIHVYIMPYWALIHATKKIDGVYNELMTTSVTTIVVPAVDTIYMGWEWFFLLFFPVAGMLGAGGYYLGNVVSEKEITRAADKEVAKILSEMKVSTTGVIIQGFRAEDIELSLRREYFKLCDERRQLQKDREQFDKEYAQLFALMNRVKPAASRTERMQHHYSEKSGRRLSRFTQPTRAGTNDNIVPATESEGDKIMYEE